MFPQIRVFDSGKGSQTNMQGQFENPDSSILDGVQHFRSEVQSCCRSSDRSGDARITGLVTFPVLEDLLFLWFFAFDVGRQGRKAKLFEVFGKSLDRKSTRLNSSH